MGQFSLTICLKSLTNSTFFGWLLSSTFWSGTSKTRQCFTTFPDIENRVEHTTRTRVFSTNFQVFGNLMKHCFTSFCKTRLLFPLLKLDDISMMWEQSNQKLSVRALPVMFAWKTNRLQLSGDHFKVLFLFVALLLRIFKPGWAAIQNSVCTRKNLIQLNQIPFNLYLRCGLSEQKIPRQLVVSNSVILSPLCVKLLA